MRVLLMPTTALHSLSLHDALPICVLPEAPIPVRVTRQGFYTYLPSDPASVAPDRVPVWCDYDRLWYRSEEHTSELQSQSNLVCRLLLEKNKKRTRVRCGTSGCEYV